MDDQLTDMDFRPRPTVDRPLLGLTILVVEDSRFTSEALRLLCLRSGARIRRADCVTSAKKHLNVYRPSVGIVDLGLPDGSGLEVIETMHAMDPRVPIILGTSGDGAEGAALRCEQAGADGFLPKPLESITYFQSAILEHLPSHLQPQGLRNVSDETVAPDGFAFQEDLRHAMELLELDQPPLPYLRRFLIGVARCAHDEDLEGEAMGLAGQLAATKRAGLRKFISSRLQNAEGVA